VCNKKLQKKTKKGAHHLKLLTTLHGKKKLSSNQVPCTTNTTDEDLIKSDMTLDDSEIMLICVVWGSGDDLRHITMFLEVLSIDTAYWTNTEKRPLMVFADTYHNQHNFTALH
jgi:hypothetical protein